MKLCSSVSPISGTLRPFVGLFGPSLWHLPTLQAHSSRRPLNNSFSHHPQVAQRKQRDQLCRVFDQAPIPSLAIAELALDHPEGVFHFGPNAGLDLLQLVLVWCISGSRSPELFLVELGAADQSGINNSACFEQQAPVDQLGINGSKNMSGHVVGFK